MKKRIGLILALPLLTTVPLWADAPSTQPAVADTAPAISAVPDDYFTEEQLVQAYRAHDFATVLRETGRIQNVPSVAAHYKLFDLMVLRSESSLQTRNVLGAIEGFTHAAALAPDEDRKAVMLATVLLLREQRGLKYLSKTTDDQGVPIPHLTAFHKSVPIDVLDLAKRTIAFRALCCDKVAAATQMLNGSFMNIPAMTPAIALVQDVSVAERAADGQQLETKKLQVKAGEQAGLVITRALSAMTRRANEYQTVAERLIPAGNFAGNNIGNNAGNRGPYSSPEVPRGITNSNAEDLVNMIQTAHEVPSVTKQLVEKLNLDAKYFDSVNDAAKTLAKLAQDILDKEPTRN